MPEFPIRDNYTLLEVFDYRNLANGFSDQQWGEINDKWNPATQIQLLELQETQAWEIAQYDVRAAYRYCAVVAAKSKMKCSICGASLTQSRRGGLTCSRYGRRHAVC